MPKVIQFVEGDGINDDAYSLTISIPDANAGSARIEGTAMAKGLAQVNVAVNSDVLPAAPASGLIYFNLQLDPISGAVTMQQSTTAQPPPNLASDGVNLCRIIYNDVLSSTSLSPSADGGFTPDNPVGQP